MTESKKEASAAAAPEPKRITLVYHGPSGQESSMFGRLEPGQYYEADASFAAYLCQRHPEYWAVPSPPESPAAKE